MSERDPDMSRTGCHAGAIPARRRAGVARILAGAARLLAALALAGGPARAQTAYWIEKGGEIVGSCPNKIEGEPMKAANGGSASVLLTGIVTCTDAGDAYAFRIEHLSVAINPRERLGIGRPTLDFDWIGLAVYAGRDGDRAIDWLYDEAVPIEGRLETDSTRPIHFGRITFSVPKRDIARATRFSFYLTAQGYFFNFRLL